MFGFLEKTGDFTDKNAGNYTVKSDHWARKMVADALAIGKKQPLIHGLVNVDVTDLLAKLAAYKTQHNQSITLTAYIAKSVAMAANKSKGLNRYKSWTGKIYSFEDVDIFIPVWADRSGKGVIVPHILRKANLKTVQEIQTEIDWAKNKDKGILDKGQRQFFKLPQFIRLLIYRYISARPILKKQYFGDGILSVFGMYGGFSHGIGIPFQNFGFYVGKVEKSPKFINGQLEERDLLPVTVSGDHEMFDAVPSIKFVNLFVEFLEKGTFLN